MSYGVTEGSGATFGSDDQGNVKWPIFVIGWGAGASRQVVSVTQPLPVAEPTFATAALNHGTATAGSASGQVVAANASRRYIEIANTGDFAVFLRFGAAAAVSGSGGYLPPKSVNRWAYSGEVRCIRETAATSNVVLAFVEW